MLNLVYNGWDSFLASRYFNVVIPSEKYDSASHTLSKGKKTCVNDKFIRLQTDESIFSFSIQTCYHMGPHNQSIIRGKIIEKWKKNETQYIYNKSSDR